MPRHPASAIDAVVDAMLPSVEMVIHGVVDVPVRAGGRLDPPILRSALDGVSRACPALACRYRPGLLRDTWEADPAPDWPVDIVADLPDDHAAQAALDDWVSTPFPFHGGLPVRLRILPLPDQDRLLLTVSHLLVDAGGARGLLYRLAEAVRHLRADPSWAPPPGPFGRRGFGRVIPALWRLGLRRVLAGWWEEARPTAPARLVPLPGAPCLPGRLRVARLRVPSDTVSAARSTAGSATLNDLLLAALARAVATRWGPGHGTVGFLVTADLRRHVPGDESLTNLSSVRPFDVEVRHGEPPPLLLARIQHATARWKHNGRSLGTALLNATAGALLPHALLKAAVGRTLDRAARRGGRRLLFTNTGSLDPACLDFGSGPASDAMLLIPAGRPPRLLVGASTCGGALTLSAGWSAPSLPEAEVQALLEDVQRGLDTLSSRSACPPG